MSTSKLTHLCIAFVAGSVRTSAGEEFEYSIENVNGVLSPIEIEVCVKCYALNNSSYV